MGDLLLQQVFLLLPRLALLGMLLTQALSRAVLKPIPQVC